MIEALTHPGILTYPAAQLRPMPNTIGGISYEDPFQWLEADSDEVLAWQAAQNRLARDHLRSTPLWDRCRATVERLYANAFWHWAPERHGDRWFRQLVPDGARLSVLEVASSPAGPGRRVVDLNAEAGGTIGTFVFWEPSPDGRRLAYGVSDRSGMTRVRVVDVDSTQTLLEGLPHSGVASVAWLADGTSFYYVARQPSGASGSGREDAQVYLKRLLPDTAPEPQQLRFDPPAWRVSVSPDGRYALAYGVDQCPHYVRDLVAESPWKPFLGRMRATFRGTVVGGRFVAVTDEGAPNGRLVAIPLTTPTDPTTWDELLAPGDSVLLTVTPVGERLVVGEHVGGASRLRVLRLDGTVETEIPLPDEGLAWLGPDRTGGIVAAGDDECTFVFSSLTRSPATYRYDLATGELETLIPPKAVVDNVVVQHRAAPGSDGTPIPYTALARADLDLSVPQPTIISAYGALANTWPPAYLFTLPAAWVQLGGVYVHAHPRGGGELGPRWWQAARRHAKQRTFDDLYAVADELVARGQTTPCHLGLFGTSAGSLPAAVAITQRPDLFRASVPMLPLLDLLRCRQDSTTMAAIVRPELGNPDDSREARVLHAYSPYHHVEKGTSYPAVLLDCAATDHICPAWHGRKMAARLQHATSSERPILLRVRDCGHNPEMTPAQMQERETEELAFFVAELGLGL